MCCCCLNSIIKSQKWVSSENQKCFKNVKFDISKIRFKVACVVLDFGRGRLCYTVCTLFWFHNFCFFSHFFSLWNQKYCANCVVHYIHWISKLGTKYSFTSYRGHKGALLLPYSPYFHFDYYPHRQITRKRRKLFQ